MEHKSPLVNTQEFILFKNMLMQGIRFEPRISSLTFDSASSWIWAQNDLSWFSDVDQTKTYNDIHENDQKGLLTERR